MFVRFQKEEKDAYACIAVRSIMMDLSSHTLSTLSQPLKHSSTLYDSELATHRNVAPSTQRR